MLTSAPVDRRSSPPGPRRRRRRTLLRDEDLLAVGERRGEVQQREVGAVARAAGAFHGVDHPVARRELEHARMAHRTRRRRRSGCAGGLADADADDAATAGRAANRSRAGASGRRRPWSRRRSAAAATACTTARPRPASATTRRRQARRARRATSESSVRGSSMRATLRVAAGVHAVTARHARRGGRAAQPSTTKFTSFGARTISLTISRPVERPPRTRARPGRRQRLGLVDVGGDLELVAHLAVDLHDQRDRLLGGQRRVERRPRRHVDRRRLARAPPATAPRRRTARTARASAPARGAPPRARRPPSSVARISFVSTISFEIAVLNRNRSMSSVTPLIVLCVRRTSASGSVGVGAALDRVVHRREHPAQPRVHAGTPVRVAARSASSRCRPRTARRTA